MTLDSLPIKLYSCASRCGFVSMPSTRSRRQSNHRWRSPSIQLRKLWRPFARDHNVYSVPMFGLRISLPRDFYRTKMKGPDRPKRYLWVEALPARVIARRIWPPNQEVNPCPM
jgi:hypothetical protein